MVGGAQEGAVRDIRCAAVSPEVDVVGVAPRRRGGAVGPDAAAIANCERHHLRVGEESLRAAEGEDRAVVGHERSPSLAAAAEFIDRRQGHRLVDVVEPSDSPPRDQIALASDDAHRGAWAGAGVVCAGTGADESEEDVEVALLARAGLAKGIRGICIGGVDKPRLDAGRGVGAESRRELGEVDSRCGDGEAANAVGLSTETQRALSAQCLFTRRGAVGIEGVAPDTCLNRDEVGRGGEGCRDERCSARASCSGVQEAAAASRPRVMLRAASTPRVPASRAAATAG